MTGPMPAIDHCDPWPEPPKASRGRKRKAAFVGRLADGTTAEIKLDIYTGAPICCEGCNGSGWCLLVRGGLARCSRRCLGGSRRIQATAAILDHACERSSMPRVPEALLCMRVVEILPAFGMDGEDSDPEWTGRRGYVVRVHASKDVDVELLDGGGELSVYHTRLNTLGALRGAPHGGAL